MKKLTTPLLIIIIFTLVGSVVYINIQKQKAIDHSKIPEKLELSKGFQKWITNAKNKGFNLEADDFRLREESEIYNTKWMTVHSLDEPGMQQKLNDKLASVVDAPKVIFSPSKTQFIDYRNIARDGFSPNEVRLYGLKEDKVIDTRILDCSIKANCYFDRAYFLDNDVFAVSEISRNIAKNDENPPLCTPDQECEYTFKVHLVDTLKNKRFTYESKPFNAVLTQVIPVL